VTWSYSGRHLERGPHHIVLEAFFDKEDFPFLDLRLKSADRFVETYFDDRWYNVFAIFDRDDGTFKGWYCNLSRPARFTESQVEWVDLALDLWVWPDGRRLVLDQDEFDALVLEPSERRQVEQSLSELVQAFEAKRPPP
jgi:protein associated with RNAse G/E